MTVRSKSDSHSHVSHVGQLLRVFVTSGDHFDKLGTRLAPLLCTTSIENAERGLGTVVIRQHVVDLAIISTWEHC